MPGLKPIPSNGDEGKQSIEESLLDPSVILSIYPEDSLNSFQNINKARMVLAKLLSGNGKFGTFKESNLRYECPSKFGLETTLQDMYFTFRNQVTGRISWIRLDRSTKDKGPIIDAQIKQCDWGEL